MSTYLDVIVEAHRAESALDRRSLDLLISKTSELAQTRGFIDAIRTASSIAVIAEVKRRSPVAGDVAADLNPGVLADAYERGGATCCSVLTDQEFFGGSEADLVAVHDAVGLPVLRKDFTVSAHDVVDARLMGADCVLLIAAVLDDRELADFHGLAIEIGLDVLVEVHDEREAESALGVGALLIGVNQRDLETFEVDTERAVRVGAALPTDVVRVAESGISGPADIPALVDAGFDAVLVGQSLAAHNDPEHGVRALIEASSPLGS